LATGTLIAESLRSGVTLSGLPLAVSEIARVAPSDISAEQRAAGVPTLWTLLRFEVPDGHAERLARSLADSLHGFGWYADFHTAEESFVVFAGRVFRYALGDTCGRAAAEDYARSHGVPDVQLDWP
jgi:hypothetical protein